MNAADGHERGAVVAVHFGGALEHLVQRHVLSAA